MEAPTEAGLRHGREIAEQYLKAKRAANQTETKDPALQKAKSWWQFW
jgi:hypothetical protein